MLSWKMQMSITLLITDAFLDFLSVHDTKHLKLKVQKFVLLQLFYFYCSCADRLTIRSHSFTCHPHTNHTCLYSPAAGRHLPLAGTHCAYPRRDGQAELTWVAGYMTACILVIVGITWQWWWWWMMMMICPVDIIRAVMIVWRIRVKIIRTVLCYTSIVYLNCANHKLTRVSSSHMWTNGFWFSFLCVSFLNYGLFISVFDSYQYFLIAVLSLLVTTSVISCLDRFILWNDLLYVEWDVKLCLVLPHHCHQSELKCYQWVWYADRSRWHIADANVISHRIKLHQKRFVNCFTHCC